MKTEQVTKNINQEFETISNIKLFRIIDTMLEGVQILDKNLNYLYINKAAEKQNQRPNRDLIGKNYKESWPGIEKTQVYKLVCQSLDKQKNIQYENEFVFPDGSKGWFYLSIQPIDEGILILSLDITGRIILGQEIAASEKLYHNLFENLLNGFAYCKIEYQAGKPVDFWYLGVNSAFEKLTGLENAVGKKVSELIPGIHQSDPQILLTYSRVAESGNPETFETFVESLNMWFNISVYSPEKGYFVAIFDVITDRKKTDKKLHEQLEELQRWYSVSIDREQRSIELKKEINQLLIEQGKSPKYSLPEKPED
ncbi:MAG: PAS domain-containing protein [Anaerolineaceae bacterium]